MEQSSAKDNAKEPDWQELEELFTLMKTSKVNFRTLFTDVFTAKELEELANRWKIIKLLKKHTPHSEVALELGVGIATVTRGAKTLVNPNGGFNQLFKLYESKRNTNK